MWTIERNRALFRLGLTLPLILMGAGAFGQTSTTSAPSTNPAPSNASARAAETWELPAAARDAVGQIRDESLDFDQPGFYAVVEFVKRSPRSPGFLQTPIEVDDWRELAERPNDFRGRPVTITGRVGRNKDPYTLHSRPELGQLTQLELVGAGNQSQPIAVTLILTEPGADIPLNSEISVTGYFVMIRSYYGASNRLQHAALLVAPGPTSVSRAGPASATAGTGQLDWRWLLGAAVVGLLLAWIILRRATARRAAPIAMLRAEHRAPMSLAEDLEAWAAEEQPEGPAGRKEEKAEEADGADRKEPRT